MPTDCGHGEEESRSRRRPGVADTLRTLQTVWSEQTRMWQEVAQLGRTEHGTPPSGSEGVMLPPASSDYQ